MRRYNVQYMPARAQCVHYKLLFDDALYYRDIRSGNEDGGFRVVQDGSLRTAKKFNHNLKNEYTLQIRVFDNGTPPLFSDTYGKYQRYSPVSA